MTKKAVDALDVCRAVLVRVRSRADVEQQERVEPQG